MKSAEKVIAYVILLTTFGVLVWAFIELIQWITSK